MSITNYLQQILQAHYGRDVRQAIHDAIETTYDDATASGNANAEVTLARGTYTNLNARLNAMTTKEDTNATNITTNASSITSLGNRVTALEGIGAWGNMVFNTYTEAVSWARCSYTETLAKGVVLMFYIHDRDGGLYHSVILPYYNDNITCIQYITPTKYITVEFFSGAYCNVKLSGFAGGAAVFRIVKVLN